ncbi:hypothetical protein V6N11_071483 [Hibiscus sabdariffa]|uniref:Uncharacterized protein n=1 Tax=Hibiscus sabdariffa TaxID=183260 RepID=A0ABR2U119_9ROSI
MWHNVPKLDSNKALVVKGTMIATATWRQLIGAETKEKGKGKGKVRTPKMRAAKSELATPMPTDSVAMLTRMIQNQEAIMNKFA